LAAPFLATDPPLRILVLAPARQIRRQLVEHSPLTPSYSASVSCQKRQGRPLSWRCRAEPTIGPPSNPTTLSALPNSISPTPYENEHKPPRGLFDLIVVDEAHHAPAETWRAVLDQFH
jgi:type I site-specific restriction endonuclease